MKRLFLLIACIAGLVGCGTGGGLPAVTDSSGNPVRIGADPNASIGPGRAGWPEPSGVQRNH